MGVERFKMEDTWESNVSPLMMGVGMNDMRGLGDIQPSCSGQDMPQDMNHQNMPQHHPDINRDIDQDMGRELNHEIPHHQDSLGQGDYFNSQVRYLTLISVIQQNIHSTIDNLQQIHIHTQARNI